ncbi:hypothetical protein DL89DRAFT_269677 [Linderina pennispora]|uniref:Complex 1 LYR protein domain-containing protein n=1 Tax=Linderina pennispora TaxID=61395 RepID=A0A1Y1W1Z1_9FUNG|nr:uncharacterized protein DL89DRAFT_269677 [Linderina pennispora]KAJ1933672.1 ndufa6 NADH-ubiquinone oxidoreductase subunit [Linderina pennispora]ORX67256.1 hypothetical protein DL89DRAFT_269677 [Linderina pennispora]
MPHLPPLVTRTSASLAEARTRSIQLYRQWQKSVPQIMIDYHLSMPQAVVRSKIREEFEKHRFVSDPRVIDVLLFKSRIELEEFVNVWKQYPHAMRYFDENEKEPESTKFLDKFVEGRA